VENRNGLIVNTEVFEANGTAERDAMLDQIPVTQAGTRDMTRDFAAECRHLRVTPHVPQNDGRKGSSAIDARHAGYTISQRKRKRIPITRCDGSFL